jgi:hypothetical protein
MATSPHGVRMEATVRYVDDFRAIDGDWRILNRYVVMGDTKITQLDAPVVFPETCIVQTHDTNDFVYQENAKAAREVAALQVA